MAKGGPGRRKQRRARNVIVPPGLPFNQDHPSWAVISPLVEEARATQRAIDNSFLAIVRKSGRDADISQIEKAVKEGTARIGALSGKLEDYYDLNNPNGIKRLYREAWNNGFKSNGIEPSSVDKPGSSDTAILKRRILGTAARPDSGILTSVNKANLNTRRSLKAYGEELTTKLTAHKKRGFVWFNRTTREQEVSRIQKGMFVQEFQGLAEGERTRKIKFWGQRPVYAAKYQVDGTQDIYDGGERVIGIKQHYEMMLKQVNTDVYNKAFLKGMKAGAKAGGDTMVLVLDGPECGWSSHEDPRKANGLTVTVDEALRFPLAHPHCRRSFMNQTQPVKPKEKKIQKEGQGALSAAGRGFARQAVILGGAAVSTYLAASAVRAAIVNLPPLIASLRQDLVPVIPRWQQWEIALEDAKKIFLEARPAIQETLNVEGRNLVSVGTQGTRWDDTGAVLFPPRLRNSTRPAAEITSDFIRNSIQQEVDDYLQHGRTPGEWVKPVLGDITDFADDVAKEDVLNDFADYVLYNQHKNQGFLELMQRENLVSEALGEGLGGDPVAAIRFHVVQPRGVNLGGLSRNSTKTIIKYWKERDASAAGSTLVKQLARSIDPFPVIKTDFGKVNLWIRVNQKGRVDIAEKLWFQHRTKLLERGLADVVGAVDNDVTAKINSLDLERIRRRFGGELPLVTKQDLIDALLPRITLNPGGLFSATVARVDGQVQWAGRFLGRGKLAWANVETRFRTWTINRAIVMLKEGRPHREVMAFLKESAITDFNLFRNSPLVSQAKVYGTQLQSIATKFVPDKDVIRIKNRFQFFGQVWDKENKRWVKDPTERGLLTNVVVFPGKTVRFGYQRGLDGFHWMIFKLHAFRGSLLQVSRDVGVRADQLSEILNEAQSKFSNVIYNLKPKNLRNLESWEEIARYFGGITEPTPPLAKFQTATRGIPKVTGFRPGMEALREDVARLDGHWDDVFQGKFNLRIKIIDDLDVAARWDPEQKVILVDDSTALEWNGSHRSLRSRGVGVKWFPNGTDVPIGTVSHEAGHQLMDALTPSQYRRMWVDILETDPRIKPHPERLDPKYYWYGLDRPLEKQTELVQRLFKPDLTKGPLTKQEVDSAVRDLLYKKKEPKALKRVMNNFTTYPEEVQKFLSGTPLNQEETAKAIEFLRTDPKGPLLAKEKGFENVLDMETVLGLKPNQNFSRIRSGVSMYATTSPQEFVAEAYSEWISSPHPRNVAQAVGEFLEEELNPRKVTLLPNLDPDELRDALDMFAGSIDWDNRGTFTRYTSEIEDLKNQPGTKVFATHTTSQGQWQWFHYRDKLFMQGEHRGVKFITPAFSTTSEDKWLDAWDLADNYLGEFDEGMKDLVNHIDKIKGIFGEDFPLPNFVIADETRMPMGAAGAYGANDGVVYVHWYHMFKNPEYVNESLFAIAREEGAEVRSILNSNLIEMYKRGMPIDPTVKRILDEGFAELEGFDTEVMEDLIKWSHTGISKQEGRLTYDTGVVIDHESGHVAQELMNNLFPLLKPEFAQEYLGIFQRHGVYFMGEEFQKSLIWDQFQEAMVSTFSTGSSEDYYEPGLLREMLIRYHGHPGTSPWTDLNAGEALSELMDGGGHTLIKSWEPVGPKMFNLLKHTTLYGQTNGAEFFAEQWADTLGHRASERNAVGREMLDLLKRMRAAMVEDYGEELAKKIQHFIIRGVDPEEELKGLL